MKKLMLKKRWQIILSGTLIVTVPIIGLAMFVYIFVSGHLKDIFKEENSLAALNIARHIENELENNIRNGDIFITRQMFKEAVRKRDRESITAHLSAFVNQVISLEGAIVTDREGIVLANFSEDMTLIGKSFSDRDWYKGVSRNWEPYVSEFHLSARKPLFSIAIPIRAFNNSVIGVLVLQPSESFIQDAIAHIPAQKIQQIYVVDRKGNLIYQLDNKVERIIEFSGFPSISKVITGQSGVETLINSDGIAMMTAYRPVNRWGWGVIVQRAEKEVYASIRELTYGLFAFTAIMLAIGIAMAYRRSETIFALKKLSQELERRVVERTSELTTAMAFLREEMDSSLEAKDATLKEKAFSEAMLESLPGIFYLFDRTGRFLRWNQAFETISGYSPEEITVMSPLDFFAGEDRALIKEKIENVFDLGGTSVEATFISKDGRRTPHYFVGVRFVMDEVPCCIGTGIDITERKHLESQLIHSQKMESIGTLAGGIAHDFNNILSAIIGYGHVAIMNMGEDDPQRSNIEHMLEASERAAVLTKDLLLFSRKQIIEQKPVDLNVIVRKMEKFLKRVIGDDIVCKTIITEHSLSVFADSNQIEQVFMSLATNACDAMPKGGTFKLMTERVNLDTEFISAHGFGVPGPYAIITVSDTGSGMDEETRKRIFDPFFTTKEVGKGTGLGLAVAYGIIKQHNGYINVYSEPGKGSTFRIYLPIITAEEIEEPRAFQAEVPKGGTETVLVAEDNEELRLLSCTVLKNFGYTVIEAVDGEDALLKFKQNKESIQILLFDLIMPKMNGKEAFDEIKKIKPDMKVLFASGYTPDFLRQKASVEESTQIISKPVSPFELLAKVRSMLDGKI